MTGCRPTACGMPNMLSHPSIPHPSLELLPLYSSDFELSIRYVLYFCWWDRRSMTSFLIHVPVLHVRLATHAMSIITFTHSLFPPELRRKVQIPPLRNLNPSFSRYRPFNLKTNLNITATPLPPLPPCPRPIHHPTAPTPSPRPPAPRQSPKKPAKSESCLSRGCAPGNTRSPTYKPTSSTRRFCTRDSRRITTRFSRRLMNR